MKQIQKEKQVQKHEDEEMTEVAPVPQDEAQQVSQDAADLLEEIECCLAKGET